MVFMFVRLTLIPLKKEGRSAPPGRVANRLNIWSKNTSWATLQEWDPFFKRQSTISTLHRMSWSYCAGLQGTLNPLSPACCQLCFDGVFCLLFASFRQLHSPSNTHLTWKCSFFNFEPYLVQLVQDALQIRLHRLGQMRPTFLAFQNPVGQRHGQGLEGGNQGQEEKAQNGRQVLQRGRIVRESMAIKTLF